VDLIEYASRMRLAVCALLATGVALADPTPPMTPDIPATYVEPRPGADFERRVVMIPMRDGVKLHTVIMVPKGAKRAPIVLTRTPYNADKRTERANMTGLDAAGRRRSARRGRLHPRVPGHPR
jgi:predicted acyl esterase